MNPRSRGWRASDTATRQRVLYNWHHGCQLQCNKTKPERAAKRQADIDSWRTLADSTDAASAIQTKSNRHSSVESAGETEQCCFCQEPANYTELYAQHLVLTPVLDNVPCNYKTKSYWLNLAQAISLH